MESSQPGLVLKPSRQPRRLASPGGRGSWVITACFPRPQVGERPGEATLFCCPPTGAQVMRPSAVKFFSRPHLAWVWRPPPPQPPPPLRRAKWPRRQIPKTAPPGRVAVEALASRPSGVAVGELGARRSQSPAHPLLPAPCTEPPGPAGWARAGACRIPVRGSRGALVLEVCPDQRPFSEPPDLVRRQPLGETPKKVFSHFS